MPSRIDDDLECGARSLACLGYEDPTNYDKVGGRLFAQACCCPATLVAANTSLLEGEEADGAAGNIPCSSGLSIGPKGAEAYGGVCRSQIICGLLCLGAPVLYTENVILRQRIRQKYGLRHSSSCAEMAANCCYPCTLVQAHTLLRERQFQEANALRHSISKDVHGPLEAAMRAMRRTAANDVARNQAVNADQRRSAQVPHRPEKDAATSVGVVPADDAALARDTQRGAAAAASGGGADELKESLSFTAHAHTHASGEETPDKVTLFGRERPAPTRQLPAASASSASGSRSTSIPPVEYTDSPRMGGGGGASTGAAATTSFAASSASHDTSAHHHDAESALTDSASFPVPAALPIPTMVREPPTFAVPPTLKPPDSMDSEVVAAWMQGPKLTHLSQSLQRPAQPETSRNGPAAAPAGSSRAGAHHPTTSVGSDASLFSIALDPPSLHASPMPLMPGSHGSRAAAATAISPVVVASSTASPPEADSLPPLTRLPGPTSIGGSSDGTGRGSSSGGGGLDTITSSKLSAMIDREMLNGGSSGGGSTAGPTPSQSAVFRDSTAFRHSVMAPIAEEEAAVAGGTTGASTPSASVTALPLPPSAALTDSVVLGASVALGHGGMAAAAPPARNSTQQRTSQQRGSSAAPSSGMGGLRAGGPAAASRGSRGGAAGPNVAVAAGSAALTSLSRMGSENGSGGGAAPGGGNNRRSGPSSLQRRATGGSSSSLAPARASVAQPRASVAKPDGVSAGSSANVSRRTTVATGDGMGASGDNFSSLHTQPPPPPHQPYLHHPAADGLDDDAVNLASIRPSFIDAPNMEQFKSALRAAGERADASMAAAAPVAPAGVRSSGLTQTPPPPAAATAAATATASRSSSRLGGAVAVVGHIPPASAGSCRYGGAAAAPAAAMYASYCGEGPSHESGDHDSALEDEASSAMDGPVSSAEASSATASSTVAGGNAAAARRGGSAAAAKAAPQASSSSSSRASGATAMDGDASVSVAVLRPTGLAVGASAAASVACGVGGPQPATSPSADVSALSASRQSASGLSNGDPGAGTYGPGPYDSTADSAVAVSQQRKQTWMNWMTQSYMSGGVGSDAGSSRVMRSGLGRPGGAPAPGVSGVRAAGGGGGRGGAAPEPASSSNSVSVNQRDVQDDAASGPVYRRWT
ncbi:hypothetical protein CHLRE_12g512450v5 [Chlamydomonas reinhardtii]|uniref:Uncharacterized protein n=1 Tax=Chlamydomonas reinhardtii TaxID=3055 RepID=A0A2K3D2H4_CHLRE|nr:uncharacterized protein CHLRE_12g512450v5 [Chlamydomonas reinhardtii]PNW74732.1 hypothetical protein CHLRE_12g512450v5 [Chlamydomonas reinhardtii]